MVRFKKWTEEEKEALMRVEPNKLDELLHPVFDKSAAKWEAMAELPPFPIRKTFLLFLYASIILSIISSIFSKSIFPQ